MNKLMNSCYMIALLINILMLFGAVEVLADYVVPEVKTQVNQRTDLFDKSVNNLPDLERELEDGVLCGKVRIFS